MRRKAQWVAFIAAALLLIAAAAVGPRLRDAYRAQIPPQVMAEALVPEPAALTWLALGHREAVSDLLWLEAQSFSGLMAQRGVQHEHHLEPLMDGIIALDPNFYQVFMWAGTILFYEEEIRPEAVLNASRYLRIGIERFPRSWLLHRSLAMNLWYELQLDDPILTQMYREEAAVAMRRAAALPDAPAHLHSVAATMARGRRSYAVQRDISEEAVVTQRLDRDDIRRARYMARSVYGPEEAEALIWGAQHTHNAITGLTPMDLMTQPSRALPAQPWQLRQRRADL